ncbi:MAG: hypothetical protein JNK82_21000 [Myxococcaceae bacterium]|nr:hypothetical protein [Myxococcaceae bacterium]
MIIRNSPINSARRSLPLDSIRTAPRTERLQNPLRVDSFESTSPVAAANIVPATRQSTPATTSSSSSGGFFSRLFSGLKNIAAGWLGTASTWLSQNAGGLIDKAKTFVADTVGGLLNKASTWLGNLLSGWKTKLEQ